MLLFACDFLANHDDTDAFIRELGLLAMVRAQEVETQAGGFLPVLAVGNLLAEGEYIDYLYIFVRKSEKVPAEATEWIHSRYGALDLASASST